MISCGVAQRSQDGAAPRGCLTIGNTTAKMPELTKPGNTTEMSAAGRPARNGPTLHQRTAALGTKASKVRPIAFHGGEARLQALSLENPQVLKAAAARESAEGAGALGAGLGLIAPIEGVQPAQMHQRDPVAHERHEGYGGRLQQKRQCEHNAIHLLRHGLNEPAGGTQRTWARTVVGQGGIGFALHTSSS